MKRIALLVAAVILGAVLVVAFILKDEKSPQTSESTISEQSSIAPAEENTEEVASTKGAYVDYSEALLTDSTYETKILFFHAAWCPQCRELEDSILSGNIPDNTLIIKVDYDDNQSLRSKYGVTIQTTLVKISGGGDFIKKFVAYDEPNLAAVLENLL